jgi:hypothetical protein
MGDNPANPNYGLPEPNFSDQPVRFLVYRQPQANKIAPTMAPPVALPQGVVVDLDCSGMETAFYDNKSNHVTTGDGSRDDFCASSAEDRTAVTIMFSPTGEVDKVYANDKPGFAGSGGIIPAGLIFLNIGIWERAGCWDSVTKEIVDTYLPDEIPKRRNNHDMNNYWITIFPRNGLVRVNRVANSDAILSSMGRFTTSRSFARSLLDEEVK